MTIQNKKAVCVRKVGNWSKIEAAHRFDKKSYNKIKTKDDIPIASPKLDALFEKIKELDEKDQEKHGKVFKHMIYSDVKTLGYGAKIIASAFIANGFTPSYDKDFTISPTSLKKTPRRNFAVLCSTPVYEKPITVRLKQDILKTFNARPDNVHGENIRFLILDQGYKEGIDVFDIKYIHLFEPTITAADEKQAIGRGTRLCGQQGLSFHAEKGWPLYVFRYDSLLPKETVYKEAPTIHELFLELSGYDRKAITLGTELDRLSVLGAVDYELNKNIHAYQILGSDKQSYYRLPHEVKAILYSSDTGASPSKSSLSGNMSRDYERLILYGREYYKGQPIKCKEGCKGTIPASTTLMLLAWLVAEKDKTPFYTKRPRPFLCKAIVDNKGYCDILNLAWQNIGYFIYLNRNTMQRRLSILDKDKFVYEPHLVSMAELLSTELQNLRNLVHRHRPPTRPLGFAEMREYIEHEFGDYKWDKIKLENKCATATTGGATIVEFTPTQKFIKDYFQPQNPYKGMLVYGSVGSGKTCSAIATATNSFEKQGYSILWVTRHTLKSDIWKNMFDQICHVGLQEQMRQGLEIPPNTVESVAEKRRKYLSPQWLDPISYKQFSNFLSGKNKKLEEIITARNGKTDPLRKTLIILDEAHKLYAQDVVGAEKPDVNVLRKMIHASYEKSGVDSARVLLMTATPYTSDPLDLIKLLNFLREKDDQLPETLPEFTNSYLDDRGHFTAAGMAKLLEQITGYISYLNREYDMRQFAYPIIKDVKISISKTPDFASQERHIENLETAVNKYDAILIDDIPEATKEIKQLHQKEREHCMELPTPAERTRCKQREKEDYQNALQTIKEKKEKASARKKEIKQELRDKKKELTDLKDRDISQETILKQDCL